MMAVRAVVWARRGRVSFMEHEAVMHRANHAVLSGNGGTKRGPSPKKPGPMKKARMGSSGGTSCFYFFCLPVPAVRSI